MVNAAGPARRGGPAGAALGVPPPAAAAAAVGRGPPVVAGAGARRALLRHAGHRGCALTKQAGTGPAGKALAQAGAGLGLDNIHVWHIRRACRMTLVARITSFLATASWSCRRTRVSAPPGRASLLAVPHRAAHGRRRLGASDGRRGGRRRLALLGWGLKRRGSPFLTWADAVRAADAPGRGVPDAYVSLANANALSNFRPEQIAVQLRDARVLADGTLSLWLEVLFGAPPLPGAGDRRRRIRIRVTADPRVAYALGALDPWAAARS